MDPPPLKLIMVQGPREGETLEYRAGSTIRIGRLVRGNNLPIKESGISTKHLTIQSEPESGKWTVTDLDSSNGTIINSTKLLPHTPSDLHDGDTIKIGEITLISIKINGYDESKLRRNPRRQAKETKIEVEVKAEKCDEFVENNSPEIKEKRGRGRGRPPKGEKVEKIENVRVTRSKKVTEKAEEVVVVVVPEKEELNNENMKVPEKVEVECGGKRKNLKEEIFNEGSGEEATSHGNDKEVEKELDLEKMTLGEWFDYMEVNLPKQIIEETEVMIEGMRRKAERVKDYMMEQKETRKVVVG